jgi:hypothetical protein
VRLRCIESSSGYSIRRQLEKRNTRLNRESAKAILNDCGTDSEHQHSQNVGVVLALSVRQTA